MSVSIRIFPLSDSVDMFGEPDVTSAYSLSGHVAISLSSPTSLFERRRVSRLILQSLTITFEGQSELITSKTGYIPFRICSFTRELAPSDPLELSNEGHEDSGKPCVWNVVFNLPIPGWLPASSVFGLDEDGGTRYTLYATAKFSNLDPVHSGNSWLPHLCWPFRSKSSRAETHQRIVVNRFAKNPISTSSFTSLFPIVNHAVQGGVSESNEDAAKVLSKIQVLASVPDRVDTESTSFPFTIRLRPMDMDESECDRLQVTGFAVQLNQIETYRDTPSTDYTTQFPVPPESSQPPNKPLISAHSLGTLHDLGFLFGPIIDNLPASRSFSLLPDRESGRFSLSDSRVFAGHTGTQCNGESFWYSMDSTLPFVQYGGIDDSHWAGASKLKPSGKSPLFDVRHEIFVSLSCTYGLPDGEKSITSELQFTIPVHFAHVAAPVHPPSSPPPLSYMAHYPASSVSSESTPFFADMPPRERHLPAYSQLFDSSGERLIDYSAPLPLYSPPSFASSSSSQSLDTIRIATSEVKSAVFTDEISPSALVL